MLCRMEASLVCPLQGSSEARGIRALQCPVHEWHVVMGPAPDFGSLFQSIWRSSPGMVGSA